MIAGKGVSFETRKDHIAARIVVSKGPFILWSSLRKGKETGRKKSRHCLSRRNSVTETSRLIF